MSETTHGLLYIVYMLCSVAGGVTLINTAISWRNLGTRRGRFLGLAGLALMTSAIGLLLYVAAKATP